MAKIANEELGELTAEAMPARFVLAGLPLVSQLPIVGGLNLPLVGGAAGGASGGGLGGGLAGGLGG